MDVIPIDNDNTLSGEPARPMGKLAIVTFIALFSMNLLDYLDRNLLMAMQPQIKADFAIDNAHWGMLTTVFLLSYSIISPLMGWLGDRFRRTWLLSLGVGIWSIATVASGLARSYNELAIARSFLGIGEATYGVIAPTILIDLFSKDKRARLMSGFYLAMPLGSALGIGLGGWIATTWSWHLAFFIVGAPGLLAALAALFLPEPVRGASEDIAKEKLLAHQEMGASKEDYLDLMVNSSYTYAVFGMCAYTFAIGGLLVWIPPFLYTTRGIDQARASLILGLVTLGAAVLGMTVGGWASDRLAKKYSTRWLFLVPGIAMLCSVPFVLVGLFARTEPMIFIGIFLAEMLMFVNTGPCNAIISNVVMPNMRAAAYAVAITAVHFLGDIWSPWLIGYTADLFGDKEVMASPIGQWMQSIGATVTQVENQPPENIVAGLLIVVPAIALSGIVLLAGARHLPREMALMQAKLKVAPKT